MNQNPIDGQLTIIDAEGNEKLCQILFTLESEEFGKKLCELAEENKKICAITAAMSLGTGLKEFSEKFSLSDATAAQKISRTVKPYGIECVYKQYMFPTSFP